MTYSNYLWIILIMFSSCKDSIKEKELELKERELELREQNLERNLKPSEEVETKELRESTSTDQTKYPPEPYEEKQFGDARIKGTNVIIRSSHTTQSKPKGKFDSNERIQILDHYNPGNSREAITRNKIELYNNYGRKVYTLNAGKAVEVLDDSNGEYDVMFDHPELGRLEATIGYNDLEFISGDKWYKVERKNGQVGWVFSKFVER